MVRRVHFKPEMLSFCALLVPMLPVCNSRRRESKGSYLICSRLSTKGRPIFILNIFAVSVVSRTIPDTISKGDNSFDSYDTKQEVVTSFTGKSASKNCVDIVEFP